VTGVFSGGPVWALTARWGEPRGETERRDYPEEEIGKILRGNLQGILPGCCHSDLLMPDMGVPISIYLGRTTKGTYLMVSLALSTSP
jgi:hypothetical protein